MKDILQRALEVSTADYCEIRVEESVSTSILFSGPTLDSISNNISYGGNVRALVGGGWGFVTFNSLGNLAEQVKKAERQAKAIAAFRTGRVRLAAVPVVEDEVLVNYLKNPNTIILADKVALLETYNQQVLTYDKCIATSRARYFDKHTHLHFANSEGTYVYQEKMDIGGGITALASDEAGERTQDSVSFGSSTDYGVAEGLEEKVGKACENAIQLLTAPRVKGGEYTVIADPEFAGLFVHEAFGHLSEADDLYDNDDLKELMRLDTQYGSDQLTIYDSGLAVGHRGFLKYDDEGVATERTDLIRNGKLVGRLHSRLSAGEMSEAPTGSARAMDYRFPPICRMRTTCIEQGTVSFSDMIKDVSLGLYAVGGYGGETNGELFTFVPSKTYMIRGGQVAELVKDVSISGNVFTTLKDIDAIGDDFVILDDAGGCGKGSQSPLPTSAGSPHIRMRHVVVGGEGQ